VKLDVDVLVRQFGVMVACRLLRGVGITGERQPFLREDELHALQVVTHGIIDRNRLVEFRGLRVVVKNPAAVKVAASGGVERFFVWREIVFEEEKGGLILIVHGPHPPAADVVLARRVDDRAQQSHPARGVGEEALRIATHVGRSGPAARGH